MSVEDFLKCDKKQTDAAPYALTMYALLTEYRNQRRKQNENSDASTIHEFFVFLDEMDNRIDAILKAIDNEG